MISSLNVYYIIITIKIFILLSLLKNISYVTQTLSNYQSFSLSHQLVMFYTKTMLPLMKTKYITTSKSTSQFINILMSTPTISLFCIDGNPLLYSYMKMVSPIGSITINETKHIIKLLAIWSVICLNSYHLWQHVFNILFMHLELEICPSVRQFSRVLKQM